MPILYLSAFDTEHSRLNFTQFYEHIKQRAYFVALDITKNSASAEDAVHQAFLKIIE